MVKWHIGTYARIRPPRRGLDVSKFLLDRYDDGRQRTAMIASPPPDDDDDRINMKQREFLQFRFNDVFDPGATQEDIFNAVCLDIVFSALDGYNGTILAYGQTGSGKTYTITGGEHYADRGIIPRVLSTIFEEIEKRTHMRYSCYISYLEIYNENVYDLLDRSHTDRPIEEWTKVLLMDDEEGDMHFRNLGVYEAVSEEEALNLLFLGNMNRVTSDTPMNQASSRSHSIFSVMLEARPADSDIIVSSKLHLVDLAGSERVYKREGTQRMRSEGKHINLSLHHLEQVILSLRSKRNSLARTYHVPYRNSMLTSVLRGSLGGNCKSVFIANVNPESDFLDETISTCRFMQRCSEVSVDVAMNQEVDAEKRMEALEKANTALEAENFEAKARVVQLENEIKAMQAQHQRQLQQLQQQQQQQQSSKQVDWNKCEELVERLLLTGELPRDRLLSKSSDDVQSFAGEEDHESAQMQYARRRYEEVTDEIRKLGLEYALGCLNVMKENTFFASNTAVELQEMMNKQKLTVEFLERRINDQKAEGENLKEQVRTLTEAAREREKVTAIPRSKSHSGAVKRDGRRDPEGRRITLTKRDEDGVVGDKVAEFADSESDSDNDTEHSQDRESASHSSRSRSSKGPRHPPQSALSKLIPPAHPPPAPETKATDRTGSGGKQNALRQPVPEAPPEAAITKSPSDAIRKRMDLLKHGSLFVKYGRYGKPHVRFVWCSPDLEYLNYRVVGKEIPKASIPTRSINRIVLGQATKVFERAKQDAKEPFCFSIEYEETRTLDLEIADGENAEQKKATRAEWTDALQFLIKLKAVQKKMPTIAPPPPVASTMAPTTS
ncbi:TPA: hypothetical protein N0F65_000384 [Lagenidium giganteum]|uniref:Kinesin-like protein n=1 Tax=Lagenidium giganteum TaxID=4803 RepID=A0AAV2Z3Z8_9STRA|nr:TPA: hypothetical protein N0F65_000384 [Lagenidium giganteum]